SIESFFPYRCVGPRSERKESPHRRSNQAEHDFHVLPRREGSAVHLLMWNGNAACARTLTRHGTRRVSNDVYFVPRREPRAAPVVNHCTGLGTCDTCGGAQCPAKDDMKVTSTWRAAADRRQQRAGSRLAGIAASRQAA